MKREHSIPAVSMIVVRTEMPLAGSGEGVHSDNGIGYGGVDSEGTKDPTARRQRDVWDDEDEEL